jgi:hypothetical protein
MFAPMIRLVLALVIAPLWVPLVVGLVTGWLLSSFDSSQTAHFVTRLVILCATFSWGATLVLWLPAMRFLGARGFASAWTAMAVGFVAALPTLAVAFFVFGWVMLGGLRPAIEWLAKDFSTDAGVYARYAVALGMLGAIVGLTAWLIGRPRLWRRLQACTSCGAPGPEPALHEPGGMETNHASLMRASINASRSSISAPAPDDENNASFFVTALGCLGLAASIIGIAWAVSFVWFQKDTNEAIAMLSWGGSLSPAVLTVLLGLPISLIVLGGWMRRRAKRK